MSSPTELELMPLKETHREPTMKDRLYQVAVVGLMLTSMGVVMGLASPGLSDTDLGVIESQVHMPVVIATLILYAIVLSRLLVDPAKIIHCCLGMKMFLPIVLFSIVSAAWSTDPVTTLRRSGFLLLTVLVGIILGTDFGVQQIGRLVAAASVVHIVACGVLFVVARQFLYQPSDVTAMKGLTTHKNMFGFEMGLATIAFLLVPFARLAWLRWPLTIVAFALLILSHSAGSLVATLCAIALLPFLSVMRFPVVQRIPLLLFALVAMIALGALVFQNAALLPAVLSKDSTLTGRTELWALVLVAIGNHPWLGYGFDSFWQGLQGDSLTIIRGVGWLVPTAHNGYLDLLLGLGVVGAVLFLAPLVQMVVRALRYLAAEYSSAGYFPTAFIIFWLIYNLNESALLARSGMPLLFLVALSASLGLELAENSTAKIRTGEVPYVPAHQLHPTY
jgi:O-antigen ligase